MKKIFLLFIFIFLFAAGGALAEGLIIYDDVQEVDLVPGGADHFSIKVKNETSNKLEVQAVIKSFKFTSDGKKIELFEDEDNPLINSWLKPLNSSDFRLESGEENKTTFLVTVPQIVENKGYYAAIYFVGKNSNGETFRSDDGLILLGVEERDNNIPLRGGEIRSLVVPEKVYYGPIEFGIEFENLGKIHYKTTGEVEIFNILNKKVITIPIEEKNILPGSKISLKPKWNRKYLIGKYLVVAKTVNGDGEESVLTGQFWAFPWREVVAICVITFLSLVAAKVKNKKPSFE
jgi:hypothetical protein